MNKVFSDLLAAMKSKATVDILTLIDAPARYQPAIGQILLISPDGKSEGEIISPEVTRAITQAIAGQTWKSPMLIDVQQYSLRLFWNRGEHKRRAVIAGGGHISLPLTQILSATGFEVIVIDDRPEFAHKNRFPGAHRVICEEFTRALSTIAMDSNTAMIIVTRGHRYDLDCLRTVISTDPYYLGMIGSQRRIRSITQQLRNDGYDAAVIARLRAPIGLDIGAQTPEEIAVSIAAEVIAAFRGGTCLPLSTKAVNFHE